jgi:hypothetical protein
VQSLCRPIPFPGLFFEGCQCPKHEPPEFQQNNFISMPRDLITEDCLNTAGWVIDRLKVLSGVFIVKLYFTSHFVYQRLVSQPPTLL